MNRRRFLTAIAATGTLTAGCVGDGGPDPADGETDTPNASPSAANPTDSTDTPTATETVAPASVSVSDVTLQRGLVVPNSPDSIGVQGEDNRYLWAHVAVEEGSIAHDEFTLFASVEEFAPETETRVYRTDWGSDEPYADGEGWLLVELPLQVDDADLVLQWPGGEYPLEDAFEERLARSPPPMHATLRKQYDETPGEPIAVDVTNDGDVPGRFVGALNRQGGGVAYAPIERVSVFLAAGESTTVSIEDSVDHRTPGGGSNGPPDMRYDLYWATGSAEAVFGDW